MIHSLSSGTLALGINAPTKSSVFCGDSPFLTALTVSRLLSLNKSWRFSSKYSSANAPGEQVVVDSICWAELSSTGYL